MPIRHDTPATARRLTATAGAPGTAPMKALIQVPVPTPLQEVRP